jgi:hypothetical protein
MIDGLKGVQASYLFDPADMKGRWGGPTGKSGEPIFDAKGAIARLQALSIV